MLLLVSASPSFAETVITNSSTAELFVLLPASSPFLLDHDFHVQPGGFFLVSAGVELRFENGSKLVGDGGSISFEGSAAQPTLVRLRPGSSSSSWGGVELQNGSALSVHYAQIFDVDPFITTLGVASITVGNATVASCGAWCVNASNPATVDLRDSSFSNGSWGYIDRGCVNAKVDNVSFSNFSVGGIWFSSGSAGASVKNVRIITTALGILAEGLRASVLGPLAVAAQTGQALTLRSTIDLVVSAANLSSATSFAAVDTSSLRLILSASDLEGAAGALSLTNSQALQLQGNRLKSSAGVCLILANLTNGILRNNALDPCARSIEFDPGAAPTSADADRSNTVGGRPVVWVSNAAQVTVGANDDPGFVALFTVAGATLTDLRLDGAGIFVFGSSDVQVERVVVRRAAYGLLAVGTHGLTVTEFVASDVGDGILVRASAYYTGPRDIRINHSRVDLAAGAGFRVEQTSNLTIASSFVGSSGAGVRLANVSVAFLSRNVLANNTAGLLLENVSSVKVVESAISGSSSVGLRAANATGEAARNAFLSNTNHASAPGSPGFYFFESGGGNFWSDWSAPDSNGDGWADVPYNLSDGTASDARPRLVRWDFAPTVIAVVPPVVEVGFPALLNASLSFDDFLVETIYWEVVLPRTNASASGPVFVWTPNFTGLLTVHITAVGSFGAIDTYTAQVLVRDTTPPDFRVSLGPPPPEPGYASIVLAEAADNDPRFPFNVSVNWQLLGPSGLVRSGTAASLNFTVPTDLLGVYTITVTLRDAAGNPVTRTGSFEVFDNQGPEIEIARSSEPDLGAPYVLDASSSHDPAGIDSATAFWEWADGGQPFNRTAWPALEVVFNSSGNHTVTLSLRDNVGNLATATVVLDVRDRSSPRLVVIRVFVPGRDAAEIHPGDLATVPARTGEEVVFEIVAQDLSVPVTFSWDFGDGARAQGFRVSHTYTSAGPVTVTVAMTDAYNNTNLTALRMNVEAGGIFGGLLPGITTPAGLAILLLAVVVALGAFLFWRARRAKAKPPV